MRIIVKGPQGVGKTQLAAALASRSAGRMDVIEEWDGRADLPDGVVAITNAEQVRLPASGVTQVVDVSMHGKPLGA